jgi:SagB-type dehydrogenase family enzyme
MDWDTQPDPFRTYAGAPRIELPLAADRLRTRFSELYQPGTVEPQPLTFENLAILFELALGLSAWKEFQGDRWALRCNPSSGNLHPTEGYLILPVAAGRPAGLYHYVSRDHCLEQRCRLGQRDAQQVGEWAAAGGFLIGLSSIHWREAWKYGERAFRYCQHDAGHALAAVCYAAAALGWQAALLDGLSDDQVAALLGLDREKDFAAIEALDREHPDAVMLVGPYPAAPAARELEREAESLIEWIRAGDWQGQANPLSSAHVEWSVIDEVAAATWKGVTAPAAEPGRFIDAPLLPTGDAPAATLIRQRRSAVALDGVTSIPAAQFYAILDHTLPRPGVAPWDALPWTPKVHLAIFVLRVEGLTPGLYLLERTPEVHQRLSCALRCGFSYVRPPSCPAHLRLFRLAEGDCLQAAQMVSCHQEIAADGAFSLGMIAEFRSSLEAGAWWYRRLFWECGMLGQVLYLEAEAAGHRGTGIGCYFDDSFHQILGLEEDRFQDLYHFTVGGPLEDRRLVSLPPYAHLESRG